MGTGEGVWSTADSSKGFSDVTGAPALDSCSTRATGSDSFLAYVVGGCVCCVVGGEGGMPSGCVVGGEGGVASGCVVGGERGMASGCVCCVVGGEGGVTSGLSVSSRGDSV